MDNLVNVWQLNTHEIHSSMEGHIGTITCVAISPNGIFAISGSEDKTAKVWGLTLGLVVSTFKVCYCMLSLSSLYTVILIEYKYIHFIYLRVIKQQ